MPTLRHTLLAAFRRYKVDALIVTLIVSLMPLVVARTGKITIEDKVAASPPIQTQDKESLIALIQQQTRQYKKALSARNIFSPDGKYPYDAADSDTADPASSAKSYRLVGVLNTSVDLAVLMDNKNTLYILKEKDKLDNNTELSTIKHLSVILKDNNGNKELKVFDVKK
ncbi:MAG: hypothetical protein HQL03_01815 [Nitrospirae bacterium]|nr:hypothetical protein [Nitrospirota bacterium]